MRERRTNRSNDFQAMVSCCLGWAVTVLLASCSPLWAFARSSTELSLEHLQTYCRLFLGAPLRCALAFGRVELFIFNSLAARINPCPDTCLRPEKVYSNLENVLALMRNSILKDSILKNVC